MIATHAKPHLAVLAAFEIEDIIDALGRRSRSPGCSVERARRIIQCVRWLEKAIDGKTAIEPVQLFNSRLAFEQLAEAIAEEKCGRIAVKLMAQLEQD